MAPFVLNRYLFARMRSGPTPIFRATCRSNKGAVAICVGIDFGAISNKKRLADAAGSIVWELCTKLGDDERRRIAGLVTKPTQISKGKRSLFELQELPKKCFLLSRGQLHIRSILPAA